MGVVPFKQPLETAGDWDPILIYYIDREPKRRRGE
jgi:hypothetical protein